MHLLDLTRRYDSRRRPKDISNEFLAKTVNGTYRGVFLSEFRQHAFLGMPYALSPVGPQRFRRPQPQSLRWHDIRNATTYGPHCIGYGDRQRRFRNSEDCLTINVVRTAGRLEAALPVAVYIYGGGDAGGGSSDERYNLSFIVSHASKVGLDFIGVSFNYRSSLWGYISGEEVLDSGNSNIGLYDQRLALEWVQENIGAFGGDPRKVTLWGGSSGAADVGLHLTAYGGRNEDLFRAAIMQSGGPITVNRMAVTSGQKMYRELVERTGCGRHRTSLECLRELSLERIDEAFNRSDNDKMMTRFSFPAVDGGLVPRLGSELVANLSFVNVPILSGVTANEGSVYTKEATLTLDDAHKHLTDDLGFPPTIANKLCSFYVESGPLEKQHLGTTISDISPMPVRLGIEAMFGDLWQNAANRFVCQQYSKVSKCYSFIFDAIPPWSGDHSRGAQHGAEISAVFQNVDGVGFGNVDFAGVSSGYEKLADLMGTMWAGFIAALDPNVGLKTETWSEYVIGPGQEAHVLFRATNISSIERGDRRLEALEYIRMIMSDILMV